MRLARRGRRIPPISPGRAVALLAVVAFTVASAWLTIAVSAANAFRAVRPDLASSFAPFDARARAGLAEQAAIRATRSTAAQEETLRLAREALQRDPTLVSSWRTIGLVMELQGRRPEAARLLHFSEHLSRRDLPTQLWMIEERVTRNDISGALRHYDNALRTSSRAADILLPILVQATANQDIISPLAALLRTNPPWRRAFFMKLSEGAPSAPNIARMIEETAQHRAAPEADILTNLIHRMASERDFQAAWRLYRLIRRPDPRQAVRNGQFTDANPIPPFDWLLENRDELSAEQTVVDGVGSGSILAIRAAPGNSGIAAQQLVILPPGAYQFAAIGGHLPHEAPARLYWRVSCATENGQTLAEVSQPPTEARSAPLRGEFRVPAANCQAQWLQIGLLPGTDTEASGAWIDSVQVTAENPRAV